MQTCWEQDLFVRYIKNILVTQNLWTQFHFGISVFVESFSGALEGNITIIFKKYWKYIKELFQLVLCSGSNPA